MKKPNKEIPQKLFEAFAIRHTSIPDASIFEKSIGEYQRSMDAQQYSINPVSLLASYHTHPLARHGISSAHLTIIKSCWTQLLNISNDMRKQRAPKPNMVKLFTEIQRAHLASAEVF